MHESKTRFIIICMKVLIVGYGFMGREVEKILVQRKHNIFARVDPLAEDADTKTIDKKDMEKADVVIEFALAQSIEQRIEQYVNGRIPAVIATTGWYDRLEAVKKIVANSPVGIVYGPNFSVGANVFFKLVGQAAKIINRFPEYDIMAYEIHHKRKKDSPSGTAQAIGNIILQNSDKKDTLVTEKLDRKIEENELHFASIRGGDVPGKHTILFDSAFDTIEMTHNARNRCGFALGAVLAAEWIIGKKGFFRFEEFINKLIG